MKRHRSQKGLRMRSCGKRVLGTVVSVGRLLAGRQRDCRLFLIVAALISMPAIRSLFGRDKRSEVPIWKAPAGHHRNRRKNLFRGENMQSNRPQKGSAIRVEPIRSLEAIGKIKRLLAKRPRDFLLFILGINSNLHACDLLSISVGTVRYLQVGQTLMVLESRNRKLPHITVNHAVVDAIRTWLVVRPDLNDASPLFPSSKGGKPLHIGSLNGMVKRWCRAAGLQKNYGANSLRKTFGFIQWAVFGTDIPTLMVLFGHRSQSETVEYLGIHEVEMVRAYYLKEI